MVLEIYDEIYNMNEEKEQNKEYAKAVNTINSRKQKAKQEEENKKKAEAEKIQKEKE